MILNVSGRTDVVAFYSDWFMKRLKEGFIDVRNPFNEKLISRIYMKNVDLIFFCTKNPIPILPNIKDIPYPIYFHITVTPYQKDIEPNVPSKKEIIKAIKDLSRMIGRKNVVVRYDPILINGKYSLDYHVSAFDKLCTLLDGFVERIVVSFVDDYQNVRRNYSSLKYKVLTEEDYRMIGTSFSRSAKSHGMVVQTCFEERNLVEYGFVQGKCLSRELAFRLTGKIYKKEWKARNCHCVEMVDIGVYNSCKHFCKYCYANYDEKKVEENTLKHNPNSSLLIGDILPDDVIKERK